MLIGFISTDDANTDKYFDQFVQANKKDIKEFGYHHCIMNDDSFIKKVYNPYYINQLYTFDYYILADNAAGFLIKLKQPAYLKNVKWSNTNVPIEYRVLYFDSNKEINFDFL